MSSIRTKVVALGSAVLLLAASGAANVRGARPQSEPQTSLTAELVEIPVTVADSKGRPVPGLTRENFEVFDNGVRQEVTHFADHSVSLSVCVVLDATGMTTETVESVLRALRASRLVVERASEISFLAFNENAWVAMEFVGTAEQVLPELRFIDPRGPLSLREALACVEGGLRSTRASRTVVLLITQGDTVLGPRGIENFVEGGEAQLFAVFPVPRDTYRDSSSADGTGGYPATKARPSAFDTVERNRNRAAVSRVAHRSGGQAMYALPEVDPSPRWLFDLVGDRASEQYAIGFYPTTSDAGWHRVTVRLAPKAVAAGLTVKHRPGYRSSF